MRKTLFISIVLFVHLSVFSQYVDENNKELIEEYRWGTGYNDTTISMNVYLCLRGKFQDNWLRYIMTTHPEYDKEDWYDRDKHRHKNYYKFILGDTLEGGQYFLDFTIKKWPELDNPLGIPYNAERLIPYKNFYLIEKKKNLFIDYCPDTTLCDKTDTIEVDAQSKYYPFDERFLVYYDPVNEPRQPRWLSGNVHWNALPNNHINVNWMSEPLIRLAQYGVGKLRVYINETPGKANNDFPDRRKYEYYVAEKSLLTEGNLWIRTTYISDDSQYEMIYFTNRPEKTGDSTRMTIRKYHYTIKVGWHEDIRERYPVITDYQYDTPEYNREVGNTPFRLGFEGQNDLVNNDDYEDDPVDAKEEEKKEE